MDGRIVLNRAEQPRIIVLNHLESGALLNAAANASCCLEANGEPCAGLLSSLRRRDLPEPSGLVEGLAQPVAFRHREDLGRWVDEHLELAARDP